jgi:hypothetical protein
MSLYTHVWGEEKLKKKWKNPPQPLPSAIPPSPHPFRPPSALTPQTATKDNFKDSVLNAKVEKFIKVDRMCFLYTECVLYM